MVIYPKNCGDKVTFPEYNCIKCGSESATQGLETELENAYNITKLQFCKSMLDIPHDYIVVDAFTDSSGYNNTISTLACFTTSPVATTVCCTCRGYVGDFYIYTSQNGGAGGSQTACAEGYATFTPTTGWSDVKSIYFCMYCNAGAYNDSDSCAFCGCYCLKVCNFHDSLDCCGVCVCLPCCTSCTWINAVTNCYCYICLNSNCFCYYKNGAGVCQVTMTEFPCIYIDAYGWVGDAAKSEPQVVAMVCMKSFCYCGTDTTTSTYNSSNLTGNYTNCCNYTELPISTTLYSCTSTPTPEYVCLLCVTISDYYLCTVTAVAANCSCYCAIGCMCVNSSYLCDLSNYYCLNFCIQCCYDLYGNCLNDDVWFEISGSHDNVSYYCCVDAGETISENVINCYVYCKLTGNCWCFYKNGVGVCEVTMTSFPNIVFSACTVQKRNGSHCILLSLICLCSSQLYESMINTIPITWNNPVKSVYYTDEKCGTGSRVYNVIDASTGSYIACNLAVNQVHLMCCCVCCHRYEIVQCSDVFSCIKGYAIAVSK